MTELSSIMTLKFALYTATELAKLTNAKMIPSDD